MVTEKKMKMKKTMCSLFVLLTVFSVIAITPSAFADHSKVDINMAVGSSVPGCEEMNMCYMPYNAALDPGGEAMWHNIDTAAHTVTSGTPASDDVGAVFDSSLVMAGGMFSHTFEEAGTYDYFCMVHPWMTGIVTVSAEHDEMEEMGHDEMGDMGHDEMGGMEHSDDHAASGVEDISDQFTASVTSGVIHHIGANSDDDTLLVHLFGADDDGELKITLNRDIITPFDDGSYFVLINSEEVEFEQMGNTLHIDYVAGTEKIEIVGSHVVPEFGTIAMIVLAVAIISIIAITAKTKTSLIPKL
jgi:predicted secreted protein with PEFG-CTERM motif